MASSIDNHIDVLLFEIGTQTTAIDAAIVGLGVSVAADIVALTTDLDAAIALSTSTLVATLGATSAATQNAITNQTTTIVAAIDKIYTAILDRYLPVYGSLNYSWRSENPITPSFPSSGDVYFSPYNYWRSLPVHPDVKITFTFTSGSYTLQVTESITYLQQGRRGDWVVVILGDNLYQFSVQLKILG